MLTKGAIGNLVNRYKAVLKKCNLINTFGSLAVASMLVLGGAGVAVAKSYENITNTKSETISSSLLSVTDNLTITNSTFSNKTTSKNLQGLIFNSTYKKINVTIDNSHFTDNGTLAGKIYAPAFYYNDSTFNSNSITVKNSTFNDNKCSWMAGAIYIGNTTATFYNNTFDGNEALAAGGVFYINGSKISFSGDTFSNNSGDHGGAIAIEGASDHDTILSLTDVTFSKNTARKDGIAAGTKGGGALNVQLTDGNVNVTVTKSTFTDNTAQNGSGGAINFGQDYKNYRGEMTITDSTFTGNKATGDGGAIYNGQKSTLTISGSTFTGNTAGGRGGAIYNSGTLYLKGTNTFSGNTAAGELNDIHNDGTLTVADSGTVYLDGGITGNGTIDGNGTFVYGRNTTIKQNSSEGYAKASAELNDKLGGDFAAFKQLVDLSNGLEVIGLEEGMIAPEIGADGKAKGPNKVMDAVLQQASINTFAIDRILTNDVRKRLGDIRSDANTTGVWMRWDGGKLTGHSGLTNDFNTIQIGGDTKVARNCRLGVSGSFTHGDADFARGNGELEGFSFAAYATWMGENGMFADIVARIGHFSTEMNVEGRTGDMDNRVASLSGEYGWRFNVCDQFFVEPQVELAYTYVNSEALLLGDAEYSFDSVDSLIGRAGLVAGWNLPDDRGNVYARASVVQQFMGDAKVTGAVTGGKPMVHELDGEDTWLEYGIGVNVKLTDKTYIWADVERTEGANIEEEWRGTVGLRYSF